MITIEIILATIGFSLVFIYFLQLVNSNFLKERRNLIDRLRIYQQYSTALPKDVELRSEMLKADAIRNHNAWHQWKAYLVGFYIFFQSILILFIFVNPWAAVVSAFIAWFIIWFIGDIILNKIMNWYWLERGDRNGFDAIPFWVRAIGLGISIGLMFLA